MGKRLIIVAAVVAALAATTVGLALAQTGRGSARPSAQPIHVVLEAGNTQFFDFQEDGLGLGDHLNIVGSILDANGTRRVGTYYSECWIGSAVLQDGSPYVCSHVLRFEHGEIVAQGVDPHGPSDVFFSITGGTGIYRGATGQAEFIDAARTDIYIYLEG
jgi:hypothetical protein